MDSLSNILGQDFTTAINKTKICGICKKDLPVSHFGKDGGANYLRYECRSCAKEMSKTVARIKKTAPLIPDNHICPVCKKDENTLRIFNKKRKSVWCADHDHKTHRFRGWVCFKCNPGMGNLCDSSVICFNAGLYLQSFEQASIDLPPDLFV